MSDSSTATPYDILDELYDGWVTSVVDDIPFYLELADDLAAQRDLPSLKILELGSGSGRITIPLAQQGHEVTAVDASPRLLEQLRASCADEITVVETDIRQLPQLELPQFDLVIAPFRTLLHVAPDIDGIFRHLRSLLVTDGALAFDVFHASPEMARDTHGHWLPRTSIQRPEGTWRISERAQFTDALMAATAGDELAAYLMLVDVRCELVSPTGNDSRVATLELYVPPAQWWRDALEAAGFSLESVFGWFDQRPFEPGDEDSIWVAHPQG
jgi:SAM-dependent methyltransferase